MPILKKYHQQKQYQADLAQTMQTHGKAVTAYYYSKVNNWGDALNRYLLAKIADAPVVLCEARSQKHIVGIGSIVNKANKHSVVWGAGFARPKHVRKAKPGKIVAVRGPLTRQLLLDKGYDCPAVYGDPCILLRRFYQPQAATKRYKLGLVPHIEDKDHPLIRALAQNPDVLVIDIQQDIEPFIDELASCDAIASSSLHGLIASDTYGIANTHLLLSDKLAGGEFKFNDYHLGVGVRDYPRFDARFATEGEITVEQVIASCRIKTISPDVEEKLLAAFPQEVIIQA